MLPHFYVVFPDQMLLIVFSCLESEFKHVMEELFLLNIIFTLLIRDRRKMQISNIGFWESWRRSQSINRKRVWAQMGGALLGLLPWQRTLHAIEGTLYGLLISSVLCCHD